MYSTALKYETSYHHINVRRIYDRVIYSGRLFIVTDVEPLQKLFIVCANYDLNFKSNFYNDDHDTTNTYTLTTPLKILHC
jgi:hypothetical protein